MFLQSIMGQLLKYHWLQPWKPYTSFFIKLNILIIWQEKQNNAQAVNTCKFGQYNLADSANCMQRLNVNESISRLYTREWGSFINSVFATVDKSLLAPDISSIQSEKQKYKKCHYTMIKSLLIIHKKVFCTRPRKSSNKQTVW